MPGWPDYGILKKKKKRRRRKRQGDFKFHI